VADASLSAGKQSGEPTRASVSGGQRSVGQRSVKPIYLLVLAEVRPFREADEVVARESPGQVKVFASTRDNAVVANSLPAEVLQERLGPA